MTASCWHRTARLYCWAVLGCPWPRYGRRIYAAPLNFLRVFRPRVHLPSRIVSHARGAHVAGVRRE